ncbi:MAG: hypothetical protein HQM10_19165 [Candidatus Riflebacteria bacterium]|nr:hypothetical protein [Candidatus Riflebacteria bacterium]
MLKEVFLVSSMLIVFSVSIGVFFVKTLLEMLEILLDNSQLENPSSGKHLRQ